MRVHSSVMLQKNKKKHDLLVQSFKAHYFTLIYEFYILLQVNLSHFSNALTWFSPKDTRTLSCWNPILFNYL